METTTVVAPGIECEGCANSIKKALSTLGGVSSVAVDVETKTVSVTHEARVSRETITHKLDKAGFPIE